MLSDSEYYFISKNLSELLQENIWRNILPEGFDFSGRKPRFASQFSERQAEVDEKVKYYLPEARKILRKREISAKVIIDSKTKSLGVEPSKILEILFSINEPSHIGMIDFHDAHRNYNREIIQGINLNIEQKGQNYRQHSLYNYSGKYANIKSEMAALYIKQLLIEKSESSNNRILEASNDLSIDKTLKELFESFFPDKKFLGPIATPDGSLSFPVRLADGSEHDLDDLSSGEKEILYGYLRIRNSAPKNSIILLDEPELHLNPRLVSNLPEFYGNYLGTALGNQVWLITHSDALIRSAIGRGGFSVFHMSPAPATKSGTSQLISLSMAG